MARKHQRLDAFEALPKEARIITQAILDLVWSRSCSQTEGYASLREQLAEIGIPNDEVALPGASSFNRLVLRKRSVWPVVTDVGRTPFPLLIGDKTRRLIAAALISLADDLVRDVPNDQE